MKNFICEDVRARVREASCVAVNFFYTLSRLCLKSKAETGTQKGLTSSIVDAGCPIEPFSSVTRTTSLKTSFPYNGLDIFP